MGSDDNSRSEDPLEAASRDFEEHERKLFDELMARAQRGIPENATVAEAVAEIRRAVFEDEEAHELLLRVAILESQSSGYIRSYFEELNAKVDEMDPKYRLSFPGAQFSREELKLMERITDEIDKRLPPGLSDEERDARIPDLLAEDEELAALAERLERVAAENHRSPLHSPRLPDDEDEEAVDEA
jgi:hypothetical protein